MTIKPITSSAVAHQDCVLFQENGSNGRRSAFGRYSARRERNSRATYRVAVSTGNKKNAGTSARVRELSINARIMNQSISQSINQRNNQPNQPANYIYLAPYSVQWIRGVVVLCVIAYPDVGYSFQHLYAAAHVTSFIDNKLIIACML